MGQHRIACRDLDSLITDLIFSIALKCRVCVTSRLFSAFVGDQLLQWYSITDTTVTGVSCQGRSAYPFAILYDAPVGDIFVSTKQGPKE